MSNTRYFNSTYSKNVVNLIVAIPFYNRFKFVDKTHYSRAGEKNRLKRLRHCFWYSDSKILIYM